MIYQKQFIISRIKILVNENWNSISVNENWHLSYCQKLSIQTCETRNGKSAILIGFATQTKDSLIKPIDEIIDNNGDNIWELTKSWGGRWVLIIDNLVMGDCSSLKGVFYNLSENIISSCPELATQNKKPIIEDILSHKYYYNWFLIPGTRFENVYKGLPGEYIVLVHDKIKIKFVTPYVEDFKSLQYDEIYQRLANAFENEIMYISKFFKINVALSSGYDSRLIYALCKKILGKEICSYTHDFASIKISDREIPSKINPTNKLIHPKKTNKLLLQAFDKQTGGHVMDSDRNFYANGQWNGFSKTDVCLRGGILELSGISPAHLEHRIKPFVRKDIDFKTALFSLNDFRDFQLSSLKKYFESYYEHQNNANYLKQYYLDQRICGWLSYIELGLDLNESTSINLGNSINAINLMLSIPRPMMEIKGFHLDYIYNNDRSLLNIPFNKNGVKEKIKYYKRVIVDRIFN